MVLLLTVVLLLMVVLMIRPTQTAPETVPMPTAPLVWRGLLARQALLLLAMFLQTHLGERLVWVAGSFIVTLSVFPGVTSAVPSKAMRDWMPIVMMAVFNVGDLIGKALPFLPFSMFQASSWTTAGLIKFVAARVPLIVILVLCAAPYPLPALRGEAWGLIATFVLAVSGGYTATIAMTIGPMQVPAAGQ